MSTRTRRLEWFLAAALFGIASEANAAIEDEAASATEPAPHGHAHESHAFPPKQSANRKAADSDATEPPREASGHTPPPAPSHPMPAMSADAMAAVMGMDDDATFAMFKLERFERAWSDGSASTAWKADAWIGGDFNRLLIRSEGEYAGGAVEEGDAEILWDHAAAAFWNTEIGVRQDFGRGPDRRWAAFGVQGLAPYWFDIEATAYVGEAGRTALRVEAGYEILLTQRWILKPRAEINLYGKDDPATRIGAGLSDAEIGMRLRYEIRREIAPYVGIEWSRRFAATADFARADGRDVDDTRLVAGVRVWF